MSTARNNAIKTARDILSNPHLYAILDTETTGFNGEIVELAAIDPLGKTLIHEYRHPKGEMHPKALEVHGLSTEALDRFGAKSWHEWHEQLAYVLTGRTLVAYNAQFDVRMLDNTSFIEGTESPLLSSTARPVCVMKMWAAFDGKKQLGGDHSAIGDCKATLSMIKEIAAAELTDEPAPIATEFDLSYVCRRRAEIAELLKTLKAEDEVLKSYISTELEKSGSSEMALPDGNKATWGSNVVKLKPLVHLSDLPPGLLTTAVDKKKVEAAILKGLPSDSPMFKLFSWEMSKFPKITKA